MQILEIGSSAVAKHTVGRFLFVSEITCRSSTCGNYGNWHPELFSLSIYASWSPWGVMLCQVCLLSIEFREIFTYDSAIWEYKDSLAEEKSILSDRNDITKLQDH